MKVMMGGGGMGGGVGGVIGGKRRVGVMGVGVKGCVVEGVEGV